MKTFETFGTFLKSFKILSYVFGRELVKVREFIELLKSTYEDIIGHKIKTYLDFGALPLRVGEQDTCDLDNSDLIK